MQCFVYRSRRREQTYVYLAVEDAGASLPESVRQMVGELIFVMSIQLSANRKLAREDVNVVLANLRTTGFHVQFPPSQIPGTQPH